jgi:Protein of unknown function (DUF3572)
MRLKTPSETTSDSNVIALQLMAFIASNEERLERFSALSGIGPFEMQAGAQDPVFLGFMLDYALQDEALILEFAQNHEISPQTLVNARRNFPGANNDF